MNSMLIVGLVALLSAAALAAPSKELMLRELLQELLHLDERQSDGECVTTTFFDLLDITAEKDLQCIRYSPDVTIASYVAEKGLPEWMANNMMAIVNKNVPALTQDLMDKVPATNQKTAGYIRGFIEKITEAIEEVDVVGATSEDAGDMMEDVYRKVFMNMPPESFADIQIMFKALQIATYGGYADIETGCFGPEITEDIVESCVVTKRKMQDKALELWSEKISEKADFDCNKVGIRNLSEADSFRTIIDKLTKYNTCILDLIPKMMKVTADLSAQLADDPIAHLLAVTATEQALTSMPLTLSSEWGFFMHNTGRTPWAPQARMLRELQFSF